MKEIKKIFTEELSKFGFKLKKDWYFKNEELIIVVNLQKSNYSDMYFFNVGIWINQISTEFEFPKENKCHIRFRAERLFPEILDDLHPLVILNFEEKLNDRLVKTRKFLSDYLSPSLNSFKNVENICEMYRNGQLSYAYVRKEVKEICNK